MTIYIEDKPAPLKEVSLAALKMKWLSLEIMAKNIEILRSKGLESKKRITADMLHEAFYQCSLSSMDRASDFYSPDTGSNLVENARKLKSVNDKDA